jgi:hypothetical protein
MKRIGRALTVSALLALVPLGSVWAAPSGMATHATFHVVKAYKSNAGFAHAMASAKLRYTKGDVFITVTADNLPKVSALGKRAYVVYASDGAMSDRVGALKVSGNMATVKGEVMMTKVADIYIYAESNALNKHPHGIEVLSAMVG